MKFLSILYIFFILYGCNSLAKNNNCDEIRLATSHYITSYYEKDSSDAQTISLIVLRWNRLLTHICSNVKLEKDFFILEVAGKEGLLYVENLKKFYYFKRNGKDITLKSRQNELDIFQEFILKLVNEGPEYRDNVLMKSRKIIVHDSPDISILHLNLDDKNKSYFFSVLYNDDIFNTEKNN